MLKHSVSLQHPLHTTALKETLQVYFHISTNTCQINKPSTNPVGPPTNPIIGTTSKVGEIQRLIRTLCAPELADAILKQLSVALIANRGNEEILDRWLEALRNNMNLKEAYFYLFGASTKEANERPPLHGHHLESLSESSRIKLIRIEQLLKIRLMRRLNELLKSATHNPNVITLFLILSYIP